MTADLPDSALNEYLAECEELVQRVSENLRRVEQGTSSPEMIDSIYRDIHTVKGSSQLFGYRHIGEVAHAMETCLDPIRKRQLTATPRMIEALYRSLSAMDKLLVAIRNGDASDHSELLAATIPEMMDACIAAAGGDVPTFSASPFAPHHVSPVVAPSAPESTPAMQPSHASSSAPTPSIAVPANVSPPVVPAPVAESAESTTIRVPVALLDKLMTLMGEMVLVRNQVLQFASQSEHLEFVNLSQRLDAVTSEIQGEVMKTRMQPIGNILGKFQRVVRDLSRDLGKKLELVLSGTETELDKTLLEAVRDPLMHIVRNSCDHGLETPDERKRSGKSETGTVMIRSFHEGGQVIVEISDDGRGLNRDKLLQKAVEKGILTAEKGASLSDREVYGLIFAPGFSTASQVTNVSGRGVGMDVVKNNIEGIGGIVELQSVLGKGTTTRLKIPLTLAIVPAMIVRMRAERFAIPQVKLVELVRIERGDAAKSIEMLQGCPVFRLRGNLLPLVQLDRVLGLPDPEVAGAAEVTNIAVLSADGQMFGLIVDEVQDTAEVVVKPLGGFLSSLAIYSGATVLGDGSVALILDVMGIAHQQKLIGENADPALRARKSGDDEKVLSEVQEFLLLRVNSATKHAIPLNLVNRLEEFPASAVERSGGQRIMRYRDSVLPLVSLNAELAYADASTNPARETLSVVVTQKAGRLYGIEVNEILDVLQTEAPMDDGLSDRPGILGNLVTPDEVIVVVDVLNLLDTFAKRMGMNAPAKATSARGADRSRKILFAEDTAFFRRHVCAVLARAGHEVTTVENGAEGIARLEASAPGEFDLVLSDIEMPKMNGIEFAKAVRANSTWRHVPMIALTTKFNPSDVEEGKRAGFDAYMEKLNPEILLGEIHSLFAQAENPRKKVA